MIEPNTKLKTFERIKNCLSERPCCIEDIRRKTGLNYRTIVKYLESMKMLGVVIEK